MKQLINSLWIVLSFLVVAGISSCEKKAYNNSGSAEFSLNEMEVISSAKSDLSDDSSLIVSNHILISVEDMNGTAVLTDKLIPLYLFGTGFVSENVELPAGQLRLTKFMVVNAAGEVIFATPLAGSPLAYLVGRPLPLTFSIFPAEVTKILPEVLAVGNQTPDKFGYGTFGIQIIKPLHFWTMCVLDPGDPMIMAPIQITSAKLTVVAPDGWHYSFKLEPAVNHLIIRGGSEIYTFILEKEGFLPQKLQFKARELIATTKENPLILRIPWMSKYRTIVLQPGPERGKDAMISNLEPEKNFGGHKYFEATFLTEPVLTVMRSNRSLIFFNLDTIPKSAIIKKVMLNLSYDLPIPFDSTYPVDTYPATGTTNWYGGVLQQVVEPWEEEKVTWNTQPKAIEANQVFIAPFIRNVNSIEVDVTRLFVQMNTNLLPNHGMLFRLWPTEKFPGFRFASSDYPEPRMRPRLTVYYTVN